MNAMNSQKRNLDLLVGLSILMAGFLFQLFQIQESGFFIDQEWLIQNSFVEQGKNTLLLLQSIADNKWTLVFCTLLHGIFWLFGNITIIGVFFILALQLIFFIFCYFFLRKELEKIAGIIFVLFYAIYMSTILNSVNSGPQITGMLLHFIILFFSILSLKHLPNSIRFLLISLFLATGIWIDTIGVFFALSFFIFYIKYGKEMKTKKMGLEGSSIIFFTSGITALFFWAEAVATNSSFTGIMFHHFTGWINFIPKSNQFFFQNIMYYGLFLVLSSVMILLCNKYLESMKNLFMVVLTLFASFFILLQENQSNYDYLLWVLFGIQIGVFVESVYFVIRKFIIRKKETVRLMEEEIKLEIKPEVVQASFANEDTIQYIKNPLPVPRRHEKKELNFAFEPDESQMHYDYVVLEEQMNFDNN